ncbi:MAG: TlpA family protein disulfide reductase [Deltaproteobacteria bacterium]|nr:TlpA family protein disulfide reductase [Deltaproteobacteria bacterium]
MTEATLTVYLFFATWCVPCRQEMPLIAGMEREWTARGVRFVLVSQDAPSTLANVPSFLGRYGVTSEVVYDTDSTLAERYNPSAALPFVAVVDASGALIWSHAGYEPGDEQGLEQVLLTRSASGLPLRGATMTITSQAIGLVRREDFRGTGDPALTGGIERLDLVGESGRLRASVRLDGTFFDLPMGTTDDARVEKMSLEHGVGPVTGRLGDSYAAFGHGLTLSVRKVDPLGVDTTIRGARLDVATDHFASTMIGGAFNPQNTNPIDLRTFDDPNDFVAGMEVRQRVGRLDVGQSAVLMSARGAAPDGRDVDYVVAGLSADGRWPGLRFGLEGVGLWRRGLVSSDATEAGHGVYGMLALDLGPVTLLADGKWYRRLALGRDFPTLAYHEPPTLEREDQELPGNADAVGGRLRGEWRVGQRTTITANMLGYRFAQDGTDPMRGGLALHGYLAGEQRLANGAATALSVGMRDEEDPNGTPLLSLVQINADAATPLGPRLGLTAKWDHRSETKTLFSGPRRFVRGLAVIGFSWTRVVTASALYGYSTEAEARPVHYPGAEIRFELGRHGDLRLFVGRQVGGRVCVSGACREVPPFEGGRLEATLRF